MVARKLIEFLNALHYILIIYCLLKDKEYKIKLKSYQALGMKKKLALL